MSQAVQARYHGKAIVAERNYVELEVVCEDEDGNDCRIPMATFKFGREWHDLLCTFHVMRGNRDCFLQKDIFEF